MVLLGSLLIAILTVGFVFWPLFRPSFRAGPTNDETLEDLLAQRDNLLATLKDLEFDYLANKLEERDYQMLRARYEAEAIEVLRRLDAFQTEVASEAPPQEDLQEDRIEAEIQAYLQRRKPVKAARKALWLLGISLFALTIHAQASSISRIERMKVAIWPEYDDPRVFVTYQGKLDANAIPPVEIRLLVPKGAEVSHTCGLTPAGEHQCRLAQFSEQGEFTEVRYAVPTSEFFVEMYYDPFTGGEVRDFSFPFTATYPIGELTIEVQKPLRATSFQVVPAALTTSSDGRGFQYHRRVYKDVERGKSLVTKISYAKTDNRPSIQPKRTNASQSANRASGGSQAPLIVAIVMGGLILVAFGAYWLRTNHLRTQSARGRSRRSAPQGPKSSKIRFCPACGEKVQPQHRFCANCGEPLK